ncbi:putative MFS transporter, AGZA family, xanthine/uracil permease [Chitinophaga terrae (ex Kim and Jung 2007)]|uniref:Putative MFS transporter, AGZA family, xanthine/uracil permease n=1 Tax=Chitinophaga terrae (ex Kim and Jung 2007) TaxID=408074 RepID=A0A1H4DG05_9BACT|nr:NCS2 family permease [Chitinophaga terrae (ex Kim and Jung 2007)]MDQ0107705.1 AGZA family xanthine/uracil permease-like MFS transporter [Chitinophaga terrae (ex Kim and Jung 2007)]GEP92679.1 xanthine/uracil permease [Chitinophaga terrae (ex Kim and Jung 2007)]SEA71349.1 putative MFS transporter, AGZA family, xanthine/uracil permease [Chitinophaga terrae (ex Kim and Jung 2007)]
MRFSYFRLSENNTTAKKEVLAGLTTFSTMAYILAVNPGILSRTGMDFSALITATALAAAIGTLVMAFYANLPIGVAPGMGLNAFFAYTIVSSMGYSWQFALTAVFLEGVIFIFLSLFRIREAIILSIPHNLKHAISVGIGLLIALIGMANAGIIETGMHHVGDGKLDGVILKMGNITSAGPLIALTGLVVSGVLLYRQVNAALLIGILAATVVGIPFGLTHLPENGHLMSLPPSIAPIAFKLEFDKIFSLDMLLILFTLLMVNLFDTVGTLIGLCNKAGLLDANGRIPRAKQALMADAVGTTAAGLLGTSVVTAYVESASGITAGGKTGLTALTVAVMFLLSLFFAPIFAMIPAAATAPALIIVGMLMMGAVTKIDFHDVTEAIPAFLAIVMMPYSYSIAEGIVFGMLSYVLLKVLTGQYKTISPIMYVLSILFIITFLVK